MSPLALTAALWFAADPAASRLDVSGGVTVEQRGGRAPVRPSDRTSVWSGLSIVTPDVDMEVATRRGATLNLGYTPRVQYRWPNRLSLNRPLLLHQAYASASQRVDPRWTVGVNLGGSIGETDYNSVALVLGPDQAQAPDTDVLQIAAASMGLRADGRLTRRHTLNLEGNVIYRTPMGETAEVEPDPDGLTGVPEQLNVNATVALDTRVTRIDSVQVGVTPGFFDYSRGTTQYASVQGLALWTRQIRPSLSTSAGGGVFYFVDIGRTRSDSSPIQPVLDASVTGGLVRKASHNVDLTVGAGVAPYFNRARVTLDSRATLSSTLSIYIPPRWTVRIAAAGLTSATARPARELSNGRPATETQVRLAVPVTYEIDDHQQFEFGLLLSSRAPHLRYQPFEFNQNETWLYVAYRFGAGTARGGDEVGRSGDGAVSQSSRGDDVGAASGGRR